MAHLQKRLEELKQEIAALEQQHAVKNNELIQISDTWKSKMGAFQEVNNLINLDETCSKDEN
tara:strand:+ start:719 stop:904 length:186 start_codon:yes stop_codon:yes gene_type:complete